MSLNKLIMDMIVLNCANYARIQLANAYTSAFSCEYETYVNLHLFHIPSFLCGDLDYWKHSFFLITLDIFCTYLNLQLPS